MSGVHYKPEGFHSVVPYLHVHGAASAIGFMKKVFNAQEIVRYPKPDGTVGHAQLRIDDSVLELADDGQQWPAMPCALHIYVPDTDATYKRALDAGATSLQEPADQFYGDRGASVRDPFGNNWYIATQIENLSREEIDRRAGAMAAQH
jgi:PhnB protein